MARARKVTSKGKALPTPVKLTIGWEGRLGEIVAILERGGKMRHAGKAVSYAGNLKPRPARALILARLEKSQPLNRAMLKGDHAAVERIARRIVEAVLAPGVKPINRPSTARRKGGDRRALRNTRGRDAIFRMYRVFVQNLKSAAQT